MYLGMTEIKKILTCFRAADVWVLIPEMFTEIEYETNKITNKEYERDNRELTSVTTSAQGSTEMYHLNHKLIFAEL
jgi:hypothetical protein